MEFFGQTGPNGPVASGTNIPVRQGNLGDLIATELNGRFYEQGVRGNRFYAVNSAAQALSLSNTTTYTGLAVANPTGSGKNLIIDKAAFATTIAITGVGAVMLGTSATVALTTGSSTGPSGTSCLIGGGSVSVAKVGASCTLGANPSFLRPVLGISWITGGTTHTLISGEIELAGDLIVAPGNQVELFSVTTANTGVGYISWTEVSSSIL